ncbi:pre-mRNA-splicing factor cef1-like [Prunus yedoensis var. nudiflora]|uniref:Pre-mRNA-splicing factor cef1-like n=1 Tax=Prunus yedoensis var. nudiflora TaxID=2094558 RepID=A0A314Y868_PRUYE|nr:pre-mRNA-splicing factor cef1-like [Prunus yedoensis var. nudiflora]
MKFRISNQPWTVVEDQDLIEVVERYGYGTHRWEAVARFLGTRTRKECQSLWAEWLDPQIRRDEWSEMENTKLRELSRIMPAQWQTISQIFNSSRTAMACQLRHAFILENPQRISGQEGPSSFTKKAGPSQRTNNQPKSGEKKLFLKRSTPRIKIDLGFDE